MPFVKKKMFVETKQRAFLFLIKEFGYTQREVQRFIAKGRLFVDGVAMLKTAAEIEGEIEFVYFEPTTNGLKPLQVEDEFVVFDKPSGVLIHPQNMMTPYSLIDELKYQFGRDANIAHRIDQETSGLVLCAKDKKSEIDIKMLFEERNIKKKYLALVRGEIKDTLCIEEPILKKQHEDCLVRIQVRIDKDGKPSKTVVKPLKYLDENDMTIVECSPHTGRQHQIRVHLFHVKHPIVGDPIYGQKEKDIVRFLDRKMDIDERKELSGSSRLLLHASQLEFELYSKLYIVKSKLDFEDMCHNFIS